MSQYLEISLPLTVGAILLPLIAGPWLRLASQQYEVHRRHWRALFVVSSACYFIGIIIVFYVNRSLDYNTILILLYFLMSYPVSGIIGVVRTVSAYRNSKGRLRWSLQLLTFTLCCLLDVLFDAVV